MVYSKKRNIIIISSSLVLVGILIYWQKRKVIRFAKSLIGQTEISGNMGFNDPEFQKLMEGVNWNPGDQWCVFFTKVVWVNKYKDIKDMLMKLISGNSQVTYSNFSKDKSGLFSISLIPKPNDIIVWQYVNPSTGQAEQRGHAGIVTRVKANGEFKTIEGNTTSETKTNEGYIVAEKNHDLNEINKKSGLRIRGFIHYKYA
jgi:hypothetical protein